MLPFLSIFVDIPLRRVICFLLPSYVNPRRWPILDGPEGVEHWLGNFVPFKRERHRSQTETDKNSWNSSETRKARFTAPASFALCLEICSPSHFYQRQRRISACNGQATHIQIMSIVMAELTHNHTNTQTQTQAQTQIVYSLRHWHT